jgi:endonuclease G
MNRDTRQAFYSAANANFNDNKGKGRNFRLDRRIDESLQLDNTYYKDLDGVENPYDRGHLTRRDAVSWGATTKLANNASRDSCFYPNVVLQHKNFNRDEWYALETAIEDSKEDADNRFNVMCGPVFSNIDRFVTPTSTLKPGRVPSAFWKIIAYIGKSSGELQVNAFLVFQDDESVLRLGQILGNNSINPFKVYQSSTTLIERLTGLDFPEIAFNNNPMFFFESDETRKADITTPQLNEVSSENGADSGIVFS